MDGHAPTEPWTLRCPLPTNRTCKKCYPPCGKKNRKLPYLLTHGHRLPNFTGEPRAVTGKNYATSSPSLPSPWGPGSFSHGVTRQTTGVTVVSLALLPGEITSMLIRPETGAARSECHAGDSVPCAPSEPWFYIKMNKDGKESGGFPSSLNSVIVFAPPGVEK